MNIELMPFEELHTETWDEFCNDCINATMLHSRRFLSYHGETFMDQSLLIMDSGQLIGLLPAARSKFDQSVVVSHPGITYGGIIHQGRLTGNRMIVALNAIKAHYANVGYRRLQYKTVPVIYSSTPAQDDSYALWRVGAERIRCDLSCCIDLAARLPLNKRRHRALKKALSAVSLSDDPKLMDELWLIISENLARKHSAKPVHSIDELNLLRDRFPDQIKVQCALINGAVEAGVIFFNTARVWHAQYIAASEAAYKVSALDAVFNVSINQAQKLGVRFFDFGTSNEDSGKILNEGLYRFKAEFGGGGVAHEFYEIMLA